MEPVDLHERTVDTWRRIVEGVGPDQWSRGTPCGDWDVRALVNHVVGEDRWTRPLVDGATVADVGDRLDGDLLGADPVGATRDAADEATRAVAERVPQDPVVHLSFGDFPIEEYVRQLAADHLVHAWDLAVATGQDPRLDAELVAEVAAWFAEREDLYRQAGAVGPRAHTDADDPQADLLARFGRDPYWRG